MPDFHEQLWMTASGREGAAAALRDVLGSIEDQRRNPDAWERAHLLRGISFLFAEAYELAIGEAALALIPASERDGDGSWSPEGTFSGVVDAAGLRRKLSYAEREPPCWAGKPIANDIARSSRLTPFVAFLARGRELWTVVAIIVAAVTFVFDCADDTPIAAGLLYIPLVVLGSRPGSSRSAWMAAALAICLTVVGCFLPRLDTSPADLINRGLSIVLLLAAAWVVSRRDDGDDDRMTLLAG